MAYSAEHFLSIVLSPRVSEIHTSRRCHRADVTGHSLESVSIVAVTEDYREPFAVVVLQLHC